MLDFPSPLPPHCAHHGHLLCSYSDGSLANTIKQGTVKWVQPSISADTYNRLQISLAALGTIHQPTWLLQGLLVSAEGPTDQALGASWPCSLLPTGLQLEHPLGKDDFEQLGESFFVMLLKNKTSWRFLLLFYSDYYKVWHWTSRRRQVKWRQSTGEQWEWSGF